MGKTLGVILAVGLAASAQAQTTVSDLYRASYTAEAKGDHAAALKSMEEIAQRGVNDYLLLLRRGWLLYLVGRNAEAVVSYQKALATQPKAIEPKLGVMMPMMALRRWSDTEKLGAEILAVAPGDLTVLGRMGYVNYQQGKWERAAGFYRQALALYPANVEMQAGLGWSLLKLGKTAEARAEFEKVLAVAPDHPSAKDGIAAAP